MTPGISVETWASHKLEQTELFVGKISTEVRAQHFQAPKTQKEAILDHHQNTVQMVWLKDVRKDRFALSHI